MTLQLPSLSDTADRIARASGLETVVGKPSTVWRHQKLLRERPNVADAVGAFARRIDPAHEPATEEPLFLFSAGWRSGSTMLQRLVISAGTHFLWGEPYSRSNLVQNLAESLAPLAEGWPAPSNIHGGPKQQSSDGDLSEQWIANLFPPLESLLAAHRSLLRVWLAPPPEYSDREWGMKEVRLSADYAVYLRLLFPRAKFVFLVRDPVAAYASYRSRPYWFDRWPSSQVRTPRAFGRVWSRLAGSFLEHAESLDALLLRYEDVLERETTTKRLEQVLGAPVDRGVLDKRIDGTSVAHVGELTPVQRRVLERYTADVASRLGYLQ